MNMDKGIFWAGKFLYQKIEECVKEIDEIMLSEVAKLNKPETAKSTGRETDKPLNYIEKTFQTAGTGIRQFCSELIEDLIPSSSQTPLPSSANAVKVADPEFSPTDLDKNLSEKESRDVDRFPDLSSGETVMLACVDLSVEENIVKVSIRENTSRKHVEVPDVVPDSSIKVSSHDLHCPNHENRVEGQTETSCSSSGDMAEVNSFVVTKKATKLCANSTSLVGSHLGYVSDHSDTSTNFVEILDDDYIAKQEQAKPCNRSVQSFREAEPFDSCVIVGRINISQVIRESTEHQSDDITKIIECKKASPPKVDAAKKQDSELRGTLGDEGCESGWIII